MILILFQVILNQWQYNLNKVINSQCSPEDNCQIDSQRDHTVVIPTVPDVVSLRSIIIQASGARKVRGNKSQVIETGIRVDELKNKDFGNQTVLVLRVRSVILTVGQCSGQLPVHKIQYRDLDSVGNRS